MDYFLLIFIKTKFNILRDILWVTNVIITKFSA